MLATMWHGDWMKTELLEGSSSQSGSWSSSGGDGSSSSSSSRAGGRRRAGRQHCHFSQRERMLNSCQMFGGRLLLGNLGP